MKIKQGYLFKFEIKKTKNEEHTKNQDLADQIYKWSGGKIVIPRLLKMIKGYGYKWVFECWNEVKRVDCDNSIALFLWKVGSVKINWKK